MASTKTAQFQTLNIGGRKVSIPNGLFINKEWRTAIGGNTFGVENPATGKEVIRIQEGRAEDVDEAVRVARTTFQSKEWRESNPAYRGELLLKLAQLMERDKENIIAVEMLDTGKTYKQASNLDFPGSVGTLKYYAGWADKIRGETSLNIPGTFAFTRREPLGVCGQIIPWNFPLLMFIWKICPAIATGNTVVIKSAEATPLSALYCTGLIKEAGFPPGVINLISGYGKTAGSAIAHHMDINKVAFTGSTVTGRAVLKAAASSNLKKVTLELGGKSPASYYHLKC